MLTEFGSLFIIRGVGKVGKLGRGGRRCQLEHRRKLQQLVVLRTMETTRGCQVSMPTTIFRVLFSVSIEGL